MIQLKKLFRNISWRNYILTFGLTSFALLLVFGNFKSQSYYEKLKAAKKDMQLNDSQVRFIELFDEKIINCTIQNCSVTCSGYMDIQNLKNFLGSQRTCPLIELQISRGMFLNKRLQKNCLEGDFNLKTIKIHLSRLNEIEDGAFNEKTVAKLSELELSNMQLSILTENSFVGLKAIKKFKLVNKIEHFSGNSFLKPMGKTLKKLVIKQVTKIPTDPGPWFHGENFPKLVTIIFDGSNFGGYINANTFQHLAQVSTLMMRSCKITYIADGSFDFMMLQTFHLISLQNNQLKWFDDQYLETINPLRRLDIQDNPWNCTCELEHLTRVFKNNSVGFGENSKCTSPPHLAGKFLNETDLKSCEDEPPPKSTTLLTTIAAITTSSLQSRATTLTSDSISIECPTQKNKFINKSPNVLELSPPDVHFKIVAISESCARLTLEAPSQDLAVIWFNELPSSSVEDGGNIRILGEINFGCESEFDISLIVEGLAANQAYTFCIVKNKSRTISPFNCHSYFSSLETINIKDTIWLKKDERPLVISIFVASVVVSIFFGLIIMFILITYVPCLFRGCKQTGIRTKNIREDRKNIKTSIKKFNFKSSLYSAKTPGNLRRFSTESGLSYMMANIYEELEYYRKMNVNSDFVLPNRVPPNPAPPLPTRMTSIGIHRRENIGKGNMHILEQRDNEDVYTSVV